MRLKSIKLAGFKSFVDPTTVPFPSNMTAVVGPNGCGKSNIIDAVRWVMGESSAKYLRGESMTDVIFNGSSARKPVGQASIELLFDNSDGSAPGEFAKFNEISVRRRVSREGQSEYFLNGAKCRRRDITDLFLGTGLGPRSYAIIEQGMISRLIEAKPEELRIYIEEAAGISKYKERRKETENRIRRTQENLERLTDLREELERQLQHLQRQAQSAEKYKSFKQEERQTKAELTVLRWQALDEDLQSARVRIRDTELELERVLTERVSTETSLESLRESHYERTEHFNKAQARYYEAGSDIARIEQSLEHQRERGRQMAIELDQAMSNQSELSLELEHDEDKLRTAEEEIAMLTPEQEALSRHAEQSGEKLQLAEQAMSDWQQTWEAFSNRSSDARRQVELAQSRIRSMEDAIEQLINRQSRLDEERSMLQSQLDREALSELAEQEELCNLQREDAAASIESIQEHLQNARQRQRDAEIAVADKRQHVQTLKANLNSQQALLDEQMGGQDTDLQAWLAQYQLAKLPRLAHRLDIDPEWSFAVEQVMGNLSQSLCVSSLSELETALVEAPKGVAVVEHTSRANTARTGQGLLSKVGSAGGFSALLSSINIASSLQDAIARRDSLPEASSFLTQDGIWIGRHWLRMPLSDAGQVGVIERQRRVEQLQGECEAESETLEGLEEALTAVQTRMASLENEREDAQKVLSDAERELSNVSSQISGLKARTEQIDARLNRINDDVAEVAANLAEQQELLAEARFEWQEALAATEDNDEEKESLLARRDGLRENLDHLRQEARHDRDRVHQIQLQLQSLCSQRDGLKQTLDRMQLQKERLEERVAILQEGRESAEEPVEDLQMQLEGLLERRLAEEEKLSVARDALEDIDREVRDKEQGRSRAEHVIQDIRANLEKMKLESQALDIRSGNHLEQLKELDVSLKDTLEHMSEDATESVWAEELEKIGNRIQRLGAINLAAIEEYQVQSERKNYLDSQHEDLVEALEILDNAIRKIDRETRQRFKETFDKVNGGLQALFPKVFGGGNASLELTGEDLLETGVTIMARPPGKKNSTIHLLSGGEKALTAIALVFSIFQLNPAPFCMLDEVDAPLDDANVGRYANLVNEMSNQVQFIYITHNKIAMEMASQLMGVTMHEPGCSRLVSVDVEEAAALAQL
ncbi:chromosome segregation protein SMC [Marinobacter caseinilyticus]|uniref:chromosome segregation protein SMC n=1 Tax=Marinobacter caseinilyticus TaxID=2692195 RepID=UPI001408E04D|nr:chromosome segregation protein SMC [Marinobacter caseinilyticus]